MKWIMLTYFMVQPVVLIALGWTFMTKLNHVYGDVFGSFLIIIGYFIVLIFWIRGAMEFTEDY